MNAARRRQLLVIADDYGIGPNTSAGILELALKGVVTGSVLLVNSRFAAGDVADWQKAGRPMDLGWHPNLTLDKPILPPSRVPSLVDGEGTFWRLGAFMKKLFFGRLCPTEIAAELDAQLGRFIELVGHAPALVNSHQHIGIFSPVGQILLDLLGRYRPRAYIRRVEEPWKLIWQIKGARAKRVFLTVNGRPMSRLQDALGFPGNESLGGITDPPWVKQVRFFENWLLALPGPVVEMSCHPGHLDETLLGRDCDTRDGMMQRRVDEWQLLLRPEFLDACAQAEFELTRPSQLVQGGARRAA